MARCDFDHGTWSTFHGYPPFFAAPRGEQLQQYCAKTGLARLIRMMLGKYHSVHKMLASFVMGQSFLLHFLLKWKFLLYLFPYWEGLALLEHVAHFQQLSKLQLGNEIELVSKWQCFDFLPFFLFSYGPHLAWRPERLIRSCCVAYSSCASLQDAVGRAGTLQNDEPKRLHGKEIDWIFHDVEQALHSVTCMISQEAFGFSQIDSDILLDVLT